MESAEWTDPLRLKAFQGQNRLYLFSRWIIHNGSKESLPVSWFLRISSSCCSLSSPLIFVSISTCDWACYFLLPAAPSVWACHQRIIKSRSCYQMSSITQLCFRIIGFDDNHVRQILLAGFVTLPQNNCWCTFNHPYDLHERYPYCTCRGAPFKMVKAGGMMRSRLNICTQLRRLVPTFFLEQVLGLFPWGSAGTCFNS